MYTIEAFYSLMDKTLKSCISTKILNKELREALGLKHINTDPNNSDSSESNDEESIFDYDEYYKLKTHEDKIARFMMENYTIISHEVNYNFLTKITLKF